MKFLQAALLPLAASAAVVRSDLPGGLNPRDLERRQQVQGHQHGEQPKGSAPAPAAAAAPSSAPARGASASDGAYTQYWQQASKMANTVLSNFGSIINAYYGPKISANVSPFLKTTFDYMTYLFNMQEGPAKSEPMKPEVDPNAKKVKLFYGPYILPGANDRNPDQIINMDNRGKAIIRTWRDFPKNAVLLTAKAGTVFDDYRPAEFGDGVYIHHILVSDMNKPETAFAFCPQGHDHKEWVGWVSSYVVEGVGSGLIQTGNDAVGRPNSYISPNATFKSGFKTGADDLYLMQAEVVNYNLQQKRIYLTVEVEYLENKPADYLDTATVILSATGCVNPGYRPPNGEKKYTHVSDAFIVPRNGYIVNSRGHLHDGGAAIQLKLNGELVCESLPTYAKPPGDENASSQTIVDMSWCMKPVKIKKGDKMTVVTIYDTEAHPLRQSAEGGHEHEGMEEMGIMTTNFAWDNEGAAS